MKTLITILFTIVLTNSCSQNNDFDNIKIKYEALSRGYFFNITIENEQLFVQKSRNENIAEIKLSESEWQSLASLYSKIDFENYNKLEGPTQERFSDGKPHANLIIIKDKTEYSTKGFDHTNPPTKIKDFVDLMLKLAEK